MPDTPSADEYLPLLKTQRNLALAWIEQGGFDPRAFEVGPVEWGPIPCTQFAYTGTPYFFDVSTARHFYSVRYSPGATELVDFRHDANDFAGLERHFTAWLSYLRREVEAPDLWAMIHQAPAMFWPGGDVHNDEPFTAEELVRVVAGIERARLYLVDAGVAEDLLREANAKFDYLVATAKRSGRFAWFNLAFGVLWNVAVAVAFGPERAQALFETVANGVRQLLPGR
jgi:hypothetical protein